MSNLREDSKRCWTSKGTIEHINAGSLQRIADAAERMAESMRQFTATTEATARQLRTLKATVSKMKKEMKS